MNSNSFFAGAGRLALLTCLGVFGACDAQTGPDYLGEAMATLHGSVTVSPSISDVEATDAVLVWATGEIHGRETVTQEPGHTLGTFFPDNFEMKLYVPPPKDALIYAELIGHASASRIGIAHIVTVPEGDDQEGWHHHGIAPTGVAEGHVLVYVEHLISIYDLPDSADMLADHDWFLPSALAPGYHLMEVLDVEDRECISETSDCLRPALTGLDTNVNLRIGADLDFPAWN